MRRFVPAAVIAAVFLYLPGAAWLPRGAAYEAPAAAATTFAGPSITNPTVPTGAGDAIFALGEGGTLEPIAVRQNGLFLKAGVAGEAFSDRLRMEANAAILVHASRVHVIFGRRTVATVRATIADGRATVTPPALHLGPNVAALASPTLGGSAHHARRAPTAGERASALTLAADELGTTPAHLTVLNLTALDLGHGMAVAGTINDRGTGTPRRDRRLFFITERRAGKPALTLANVTTVTVTEPLLEEVNEYLIDALDLSPTNVALVTRSVGYDAFTFIIYARGGAGVWHPVYTGGGAAG